MPTISVKSIISSEYGNHEEIIAKALKKDNRIYFKSDETNYMIEIFSNHLIFLKEDNEKRIKLIFEPGKKMKTYYEIYDPKVTIELETYTEFLKINNDNIEVKYKLKMNGQYSDTFTYELNWEV